MPYQINKFNGERLTILEDGTLDSTTNLNLVGKNFAGYGETQNENFVWLLENFASGIAPGKPLMGQLWYDTVSKKLKIYSGTTWNFVGGTKLSSSEPLDPSEGDGWYDSDDGKFYVYDGTDFQFVGPETVAGFGNTRHISDKIVDTLGNDIPVIKTSINDAVIAITADRAFTPLVPIVGFTSFVKGINLSSTAIINGNVTGNAGSASVLATSRNINGVLFDGSADITIKSSTTNKLSAGNYISGSDFDGSADITWTLDASSNNVQDTVVVRDSSGNFAANTVVANLTGNTIGTHTGPVVGGITGNVIGNLTGNVLGNVTGDVIGNVTGSLTGSVLGNVKGSLIAADNSNAYDGTTKIFTGTFTGNATSATRLQNEIMINNVPFTGQSSITVFDNTKFPNSGGTLLGPLILANDPTTGLGAATKQYVDSRDENIKNTVIASIPKNYVITYGNTQYSQTGYTNQVGSFNNGANFFDVYPPGGIPSQSLSATARTINNWISGMNAGTIQHQWVVIDPPIRSPLFLGTEYYNSDLFIDYNGDTVASSTQESATILTVGNQTYSRGALAFSGQFAYDAGDGEKIYNLAVYDYSILSTSGKTMADLVAFIPSIAVIHYAGGVDGNDSLRCTWSNLGDRIRVWVQNTEQRSTPAANWLAIWS